MVGCYAVTTNLKAVVFIVIIELPYRSCHWCGYDAWVYTALHVWNYFEISCQTTKFVISKSMISVDIMSSFD